METLEYPSERPLHKEGGLPVSIVHEQMKTRPGDIVYSKAGRDQGHYFVVMKTEGVYAFLCDGKKRKTDRAKRKKTKHLLLGIGHSDYIRKKLEAGEKVTNAELRRELDEYNQGMNQTVAE